MVKVLYLVPNLSDSAVDRRMAMMRMGGAEVVVAGFRRGDGVASGDAIELGQTFDARFAQRLLTVWRARGAITQRVGSLPVPDVIIARNLEMLSLASRLQAFWPARPPIVYECLDIHRLLLRGDLIGRAMRGAEQRLTRKAALLVTSSPAFLRNYFDVHGAPPSVVMENKVFRDAGGRGINPSMLADAPPSGPLRIGWFGALRCSKSLAALAQLARATEGRVEVVLRGRPALGEFANFHGFVEAQTHLRFAGPYRNPDDLAAIYSEVHFAWAIDFFEEGQNSQWLLPNRIYEGCLHGAIPIALAGTETAAFLQRHGIGVVLPDIAPATLEAQLTGLSGAQMAALAGAVAAADIGHFTYDEADCRLFVDRLGKLRGTDLTLTEAA
ncbi:glycosyl transferase family 1 [uncultured Devosia sp.]|uniref:glycosyl transferase family 1 n=1 Tax=uncultured Devosia sp. TaxID=211434 RepID=UPI0035CC09F6